MNTPPPTEKRVCAHCLSDVPLEGWIESGERWFCCRGCSLAWRILHEAGLEDFYRRRKWERAGLPEGAYETRYGDAELERYVKKTGDEEEILLLVDGIRCASCVWVLERLLERSPGVVSARVSFTSGTARIRYSPGILKPSQVLGAVMMIGYAARPFEPDERERAAASARRALLVRFGTALFFSMQLMGSSIGLYGGYLKGMEGEARDYLGWFSFAMAAPVVLFCGWPFLSGALRALKNRAPDMDLLIGMGVGFSFGYSVWALFTGGEVYFDGAAAIVTFVLLGRLIEAGARERSISGVTRLMKLKPEKAMRFDGEKVEEVDGDALKSGDIILVRPGDRFPADGEVAQGETETDESLVTGEPYPVARKAGERVLSGTLNLNAAVKVKVTEAGAQAFIARVARLVAEAESAKPRLARLAERAAAVFVPVVVAVSAVSFALALAFGNGFPEALSRCVAVLVVACPCALGLATPLAVMAAASRAAQDGILFKGGDVMEKLACVNLAAFDKTGTLTVGRPEVVRVEEYGPLGPRTLELAASAEAGSNHPIARGIVREASRCGIEPKPGLAEAKAGGGVRLETEEGMIRVGSRDYLLEAGIACPDGGIDENGVEAWVALDGECVGRIVLEDALRADAPDAVRELKRLSIDAAMLTGDRAGAAQMVGIRAGIGIIASRLDPQAKADWVFARRKEGRRVLMAGDGINDAGALASADVGCSMGGSADVALDTADLVLMRPELSSLVRAVTLSRRTVGIIRQNLWWAFGYNALAMALAAAGHLAPLYAALAMAASSVCVVLNSLRLNFNAGGGS